MWYLDSRASNFMTDDKEAFVEIDGDVGGTAKFGNSSTVDIRQMCTTSKGCARIISIAQLDELGCRVLVDSSILRIRNREHVSSPR